jgi:hypothetical protein
LPSAKSGVSIVTARSVVTSSGSEVASGSIKAPIQAEPIPVFSATTEAFLVNLLPAKTITAAHNKNCNQGFIIFLLRNLPDLTAFVEKKPGSMTWQIFILGDIKYRNNTFYSWKVQQRFEAG